MKMKQEVDIGCNKNGLKHIPLLHKKPDTKFKFKHQFGITKIIVTQFGRTDRMAN